VFGAGELLQGQPLLEILADFYWNITDFDGGIQMDNFSFQQVMQEVSSPYRHFHVRIKLVLFHALG
jgi:hypothetical protein